MSKKAIEAVKQLYKKGVLYKSILQQEMNEMRERIRRLRT